MKRLTNEWLMSRLSLGGRLCLSKPEHIALSDIRPGLSCLQAAHVSELSDVRGDYMLSSSVRPFGVGGTADSAFLAGGITAL
jgi:hypothetical protein